MIIPSPHRRVLVLGATIFFVTSIYICVSRLVNMTFSRESFNSHSSSSSSKDKGSMRQRLKLNHADLPMAYGSFARPPLEGVNLYEALPEKYVPTIENKRRLVIVGDIHGMDASLEAILDETDFDGAKDHFIAVGDMIAKGPDSAGVVSRLMTLGASAVRGNHEDRVLLAHSSLTSQFGVMADLETTEVEERRGELRELVVARELTQRQLDWLNKLPVILTVDQLNMYIVHAGLVPGLEVPKQDPWAVMNMRTLNYPREELRRKSKEQPRILGREALSSDEPDTASDAETPQEKTYAGEAIESADDLNDDDADETKESNKEESAAGEDYRIDTSQIPFDREIVVPDDGRKGENWTDAWTAHQQRLPFPDRRTVIYGHDARTGFKETRYTVGLDSGCVKGGYLTAIIVEAKAGGEGFKYEVVQTRCKDKKGSHHEDDE